ncbi:hypothetical protein GCM10010124_40300 [Pilimelia terevasa]|uniref:Uncharacterized protein n=1 Tax=Pilimelia terevasa TaxID=53372 RepID=A0A8J3BUA6_9ACTN|nr:hypothetical protein [Pilimelia terevasa]GGK43471.1 hypothetical protein GCM10010124_40300 [Pilimelia terevasa]
MPSTSSHTHPTAGPARTAAATRRFLRPATRMARILARHPNLHRTQPHNPPLARIPAAELLDYIDLPGLVDELLTAPPPGAVRTVRSRNGTTVTVLHHECWSLIVRRRRTAADVCLFHLGLCSPVLVERVHGLRRPVWQAMIDAVAAARRLPRGRP